MPTYQYVCTACDTPLEAVQRFSDPALTECPTCQGALRKVFSAVGVVFKGSGFYKNDSRSTTRSSTPPSSGSSEPGTSAPAATPKTESTPAASTSASSSSASGSTSTSST